MGLYDCRCMLTGVSLKGADAALVILHQGVQRFSPLALAVKGSYNREGSIDCIEVDANARRILRFFQDALRDGNVVADADYLRSHGIFPINTIEDLLAAFERNINDGPGAVVLEGQSLQFALIARVVWDAIAQQPPATPETPLALRARLFASSPASVHIYADAPDDVSQPLQELAAIEAFMATHGHVWQPSESEGQHYSDEMRTYLSDARRAFASIMPLPEALQRYAEEVAELLADDNT